ncbi:hypothetical protein G6F21_014281 [Rhizopus arrhizus]|nr:hypothetical protein G6F21_014281 [Rhizopus arrhizus]
MPPEIAAQVGRILEAQALGNASDRQFAVAQPRLDLQHHLAVDQRLRRLAEALAGAWIRPDPEAGPRQPACCEKYRRHQGPASGSRHPPPRCMNSKSGVEASSTGWKPKSRYRATAAALSR